jgi:hypothetical protein
VLLPLVGAADQELETCVEQHSMEKPAHTQQRACGAMCKQQLRDTLKARSAYTVRLLDDALKQCV